MWVLGSGFGIWVSGFLILSCGFWFWGSGFWGFRFWVQAELDEVTYQSYKGKLTENQQKLLEKVQKRHEKVRERDIRGGVRV